MSSGGEFNPLLQRVVTGHALDENESAHAFAALISGEIPEIRIAAFLTALAVREPTIEEITGAARAMRNAMRRIDAPEGAIDLCGTGGDGHGTFNVSTAASFIVAACGVPVAKHGNRNMSSRSGAADVLEALGVHIDIEPEAAEACLRDVGLCFLFAPTYHTAMRHVANVRRHLGFRTVFNLLGPICNPAGVRRQLVGVYSRTLLRPFADVLHRLGGHSAWIVRGQDGLDELTTTGTSELVVLHEGRIAEMQVEPELFGLSRVALSALKGGTPGENAKATVELLNGARGPFHDIAVLNSAAALAIAGKVGGLHEGIDMAREAVEGGAAQMVLRQLAAATQKLAT